MQKERLIEFMEDSMQINWREMLGTRNALEKEKIIIELNEEYLRLVDKAYELATIYNWNLWGERSNKFSLTLSQSIVNGKSISIRMIPNKKYNYYACYKEVLNPNNLELSDYTEFIADNLLDTLKFINRYLGSNSYICSHRNAPDKFLGFGYDKAFLEIKWAEERIAKIEERESVHS